MKKLILSLILITILAAALVLGASAETPEVIQPGDVNGDGSINAKDAVMLAQYLAGWDVVLGGDSHTVVIDAAVPATCTQTGLTEGKHCSDCGMILVKQQVVPMAEHDYEETVVQPTTATQGYTLCKCKVCGYEQKKDFIPPVNSNGLAVEVNTANKTCVITGIGTCTDTDINIPSKISDYTVVGIADKAFENQSQIKSINIPNTVKTLGQRAFYGCTGLTEFTIPDSVTSIGSWAFFGCSNLTSVEIPDRVTSIGSYTFYGCSRLKKLYIGDLESWLNVNLDGLFSHPLYSADGNLYIDGVLATDIVIPDSVTSIGNYAFHNCSSLTSVEISDSVMSIGSYAFYGCSNLTSVVIGDSVTSIGYRAFEDCSSLTAINVDETNITYCDIDGVLFSKDKKTLITYPGGATTYTIPDSVTNIGDYAFDDCSSLTSVEIPDSVTSIGEGAFRNCSSLTSVEIPDSVTSIGEGAFYYCSSLTSVYYGGDATKWAKISIDSYNSSLTSATRYYYSATQPTTTGKYWHYVDGKPTPW